MREIKFRAWDGEIMLWIGQDDPSDKNPLPHDDEEKIMDWDFLFDEINGIKIMQFTGLLDKNGKEIYEGDIVKAPKKTGGYRIAPVVFHHGHFMMTKTKNNSKWRSLGHKLNKDNLEVIGNIYEHKHLLEK